jgi:hypothetical protein
MIALLAILISLERPAYHIDRTPLVTRTFHDAFALNLKLPGADAEAIYQGYVLSRSNVIDAFNARCSILSLSPNKFECAVGDLAEEVTVTYEGVMRQAKAFLQDADSQYLRMMIELANVPDERAGQSIQAVETAWRLQWTFESPMLPKPHLPVCNVWHQTGEPPLTLPSNELEAEYLNAVRPHLIAIERYGLHGSDIMRQFTEPIMQARRENDMPGIDAAITAFLAGSKENQFDPIRAVREINVKFWPRIEQRMEPSRRARYSAWFLEQTFPYLPELAEMYKAADRATQQVTDDAQRQGVQSLMSEVQGSVIPLLIEVDGAYVASHEAIKQLIDQTSNMRKFLLSEEPKVDEELSKAARSLEEKLPALRTKVERARKRFEELTP